MRRSPARMLPLSTHLRTYLNGWSLAGCVVLLVASILFWLFAFHSDVSALWENREPLEEAQGHVFDREDIRFSINDQKVYRLQFEFTSSDGRTHRQINYAHRRVPKAGAEVKVQYPPGQPHRARIVGGRRAIFPAAVAVLGLAPLVALVPLGIGYVQARKLQRLLRYGEVAEGELVAQSPTSMRVNEQTVMLYEIAYTPEGDRPRRVVHQSHHPLGADGSRVMLFYDPSRPGVTMPMHWVFERIGADASGERHRPVASLLGRSLLPLAVVVGNLVAVWVFLG